MLTKRQANTLEKHSEHMAFMKSEMKKGASFTKAHKAALKKVGKSKG
mgnify:CR=1 FL=1